MHTVERFLWSSTKPVVQISRSDACQTDRLATSFIIATEYFFRRLNQSHNFK
jgi:hypothetical protein